MGKRLESVDLNVLVSGGTGLFEDALLKRASAIRLAELVVRPRKHPIGEHRVVAIADLLEQPPAVLPELPCSLVVLLVGERVREEVKRARRAPRVSELPVQGERLGG